LILAGFRYETSDLLLYIHHETFNFMMSLPAMSLGLWFCMSRKGGTGGSGWVHPKGANSIAVSGLVV